ncbi:MAG TPA: hypothetical protein VFX76_07865 [Roseiflexaceae bacterium]|nr:hypothetical protein [Roseiflexaceae bacterium]
MATRPESAARNVVLVCLRVRSFDTHTTRLVYAFAHLAIAGR